MIRVLTTLAIRAVVAYYMCVVRMQHFRQLRFAWIASVLVHAAVCAAVLMHRLLSRSTLSLVFLYLWLVLGPLFHHQRHEQQAWLLPQHEMLPPPSRLQRARLVAVVMHMGLAGSIVAAQQICLRMQLQEILEYFDIGLAVAMGVYAVCLYTQLRYVQPQTILRRRSHLLVIAVLLILMVHTWTSIRTASNTSSLRRRVASDQDGINTLFQLTAALVAIDVLLVVRCTLGGGSSSRPCTIESRRVQHLAREHAYFRATCTAYDAVAGTRWVENPWHQVAYPLQPRWKRWSNPDMYVSMSILPLTDVWNVTLSAAELAVWGASAPQTPRDGAHSRGHAPHLAPEHEMNLFDLKTATPHNTTPMIHSTPSTADGDDTFYISLGHNEVAGKVNKHFDFAALRFRGSEGGSAPSEGASAPLGSKGGSVPSGTDPPFDVYEWEMPTPCDVSTSMHWLGRLLHHVGDMTDENSTASERELAWQHIRSCLESLGDALVTLPFYIEQCMRFHTRLWLDPEAKFVYESMTHMAFLDKDVASRTDMCRRMFDRLEANEWHVDAHVTAAWPVHRRSELDPRWQRKYWPLWRHPNQWCGIKQTHDMLLGQSPDAYAQCIWMGFLSVLSTPTPVAVDLWLAKHAAAMDTTIPERQASGETMVCLLEHAIQWVESRGADKRLSCFTDGRLEAREYEGPQVSHAREYEGPQVSHVGPQVSHVPHSRPMRLDANAAIVRSEPWFDVAWTLHLRRLRGCKRYIRRLLDSKPYTGSDSNRDINWIACWFRCRVLSLEVLWDRIQQEDVSAIPLQLFVRRPQRVSTDMRVKDLIHCMRSDHVSRYARENTWKTAIVQMRWMIHLHQMGTHSLRAAWIEASDATTEQELVQWIRQYTLHHPFANASPDDDPTASTPLTADATVSFANHAAPSLEFAIMTTDFYA
jgi:hypothetical protein